MTRAQRLAVLWPVLWAVIVAVLMTVVLSHPAEAACEPYPVTVDSPTGIVGCEVYGEGIASHWGGPGVARNDCRWPWTDCTPIVITSIETGRQLIVEPSMFCDCYTGTANERIVDLDPAAVAALGLDWADGLYPVSVEPATILPDTAMDR